MSDNLHQMLSDPNKEADKASGILARLFRLIMARREMSPMAWNRLMQNYLNDPRNGCPRNGKDRSSIRGNLTKELLRPTMTWKVFKKAIRFLAPFKIEFIVRCHWGFKNKTTQVAVEILNDQLDEGDLHDDYQQPIDNRDVVNTDTPYPMIPPSPPARVVQHNVKVEYVE